jgi:hypothetical protein
MRARILALSVVCASLVCPAPMSVVVPVLGAAAQPQASPEIGDPYMLPNCPVSGKPLGSEGEIVYRRLDGRDIRLGSRSAVKSFERRLSKYVREIDAEMVKRQLSHYPLETCIVSGEALGPGAVDHIYRNRLVRLSSKRHIAKFERDAASYWAVLDAAVVRKQQPGYPLTTCIVSGNNLSEIEPVEFVMGNRLYRVCCIGCATTIKIDPVTYTRKLDEAYAQQTAAGRSH